MNKVLHLPITQINNQITNNPPDNNPKIEDKSTNIGKKHPKTDMILETVYVIEKTITTKTNHNEINVKIVMKITKTTKKVQDHMKISKINTDNQVNLRNINIDNPKIIKTITKKVQSNKNFYQL
jgi:hypothetical protein